MFLLPSSGTRAVFEIRRKENGRVSNVYNNDAAVTTRDLPQSGEHNISESKYYDEFYCEQTRAHRVIWRLSKSNNFKIDVCTNTFSPKIYSKTYIFF